ncbi:MAG: ornithine carbamoyltransferase [bacterium]
MSTTTVKNCDFLGLERFTRSELEGLLDLALEMKSGRDRRKYLDERNLGMLFTVPSTRTRISFQVAARELGAHAEYYAPGQLQMSNNETLVDTAEVMNRYLDGLVVRLYDMTRYGEGRKSLEVLAEHMDGPVINALDDKEHPCQIMADVLTLRERFGEEYKGKKVVLTWAYAKRQKSPGVTHSWLMASSILGMNFTLAFPKGFEPDPEYDALAREAAAGSGASVEYVHDLEEASEGADVIYAKSWKSLASSVEEDRALREENREAWRVGRRHFDRANPEAVFMDCMPLIRGQEADAEVVDGPMSIRYDEAENRLHAQKAILASLIGET